MPLPSRRLVIGAAIALAAVIAVGVWAPWKGPARKQWSAAPAIPDHPTAAELAWLNGLTRWVAFVRDAAEDPTALTVKDCDERLSRLDPAPERLHQTRALAADTCTAFSAQASDRLGSQMSWDPARAGRANEEEREAARDMHLLISSLKLRTPPGGRVAVEYSRIASRLSGRDVTARCWNNDSNWKAVETSLARTEPGLANLEGFAVTSLSRIELSPAVCRTLDTILGGGGRPPRLAEVTAIEVLTHEAEHLVGPDGISDEAVVDCHAAQGVGRTARMLGVAAARTAGMGGLYLTAVQPTLPPEYRSSECHKGGRYDLTPRDGRWP